MKITAAVARTVGGPFRLQELTLEDPRADEVLVQVHATGICHSDIFALHGKMPIQFPAVLGHEGAGIVAKVGGAVTAFAPGDHVVMTHDSCGHCKSCTGGFPTYCEELRQRNVFGTRRDGSTPLSAEGEPINAVFFAQSSFATHALATERNLVKVPGDLDLSVLGQLGCGITTGAGAVFNRITLQTDSSLLVCGTGPVGIAAILAAKVKGCARIVALDLKPKRLALAGELGATETVQGDAPGAAQRLAALAGRGFEAIIDTTGAQSVMDLAMPLLRERGTWVVIAPGPKMSFDPSFLLGGGRCLCGSASAHGNARSLIRDLIELYRQGRFPIDRLVTRYPLSEINQACADAEAGAILKPVLMMPEHVAASQQIERKVGK